MRVNKVSIAFIAMFTFAILLFSAIIFACVANESNKINEGVVVDKHYSPAYITTTIHRIGDTTVPINNYNSEKYTLTIEGEKNGNTVKYSFYVTQNEYEAYKIGDYYQR